MIRFGASYLTQHERPPGGSNMHMPCDGSMLRHAAVATDTTHVITHKITSYHTAVTISTCQHAQPKTEPTPLHQPHQVPTLSYGVAQSRNSCRAVRASASACSQR